MNPWTTTPSAMSTLMYLIVHSAQSVYFAILPLVFLMKKPKTAGVFIPAHA